MQRFHEHTGKLIKLVDGRRGAERNHAAEEFNDGMVFSENPLALNEIFSVRINKRIASWSGSIEIGFVTIDPTGIVIPKGAIALRQGTWIISGTSVNVDGTTLNDEYCKDLDSLIVDSIVGIMRNDKKEIHLYIDGEDQGVAALCHAEKVWAVIDLYGKCSNVSIVTDLTNLFASENSLASARDSLSFSERLFQRQDGDDGSRIESDSSWQARNIPFERYKPNDELSFHPKCGSLIRLTDDGKTAVRLHHQDEFNNGVVMTNRTLENDELFEIKINTLIDKWSGSIEMGVTTHAPDLLEIPSTMTNLRSGTVMLSGCSIITNGKGTRKEYLDFHLDELKVGHYIGLMRKSKGSLHYYINGVDQGVAANHIPPHVYGVVDLYGMAVSVSIVPSFSVFERMHRNEAIIKRMSQEPGMYQEHEPLLFSTWCGKNVKLLESKKSARRKNPLEDFNHAVVPTERSLHPGEIFTIQVDELVGKWSGSLEIGVTSNKPETFEFPATMTNVRSGTWIMTATGVMCNGVTVVDDYGSNLEALKVGDRLAVCRKSNGNLHFFINGVDQGLAASEVPENVYGVVDLYGQASKASIVDINKKDSYPVPSVLNQSNSASNHGNINIKFSPISGKNCALTEDMNCAYRKNASFFYDNSVVMCNQLTPAEMFELQVDKIIPHWTGSLEIGVTAHKTLSKFPASLTEIKTKTWIWTASSAMENGVIINKDLSHDTENLEEGSRIGIMLTEDGKVRGYFNGSDVGVLFSTNGQCLYPIINLYGKCAQVTILSERVGVLSEPNIFTQSERTVIQVEGYTVLKNKHRFYHGCDKGVTLLNENKVARKIEGSHSPLLFSANPLKPREMFEFQILEVNSQFGGSLSVGIISSKNANLKSLVSTFTSITDIKKSQSACVISGNGVYRNGNRTKQFYCPALSALSVRDKVGITLAEDESIHLSLNGSELEDAAEGFSLGEQFYVVLCMGPHVSSVDVLNNSANLKEIKGPPSLSDSSSDEGSNMEIKVKDSKVEPEIYALSREVCGKNIRLTEDGLTATRVGSYNQAIAVTSMPLLDNKLFQIKVKGYDEKWQSSLSIGVTGVPPSEIKLPVDSLKMSKLTWMIHGDSVYKNGRKIMEKYGSGLDGVRWDGSQVLGLLVDRDRSLHLYIDGVDQGVAVRDVPENCHGVVDLYGSCDEIEVTKEFNVLKPSGECEKSEKVDFVKEGHLGSSVTNSAKNEVKCLIKSKCHRFLKTLSLPEAFFVDNVTCYCNSCFKYRGESEYKCQGDPALQYAQPVGWCKFSLRVHPNVDIGMISKCWNVAYYGTKVGAVRKILDLGEVPFENTPIWDLRTSSKEDEDFPTKRKLPVIISPTIHYAGDDKFSPKAKYNNKQDSTAFSAKVAFQLFIQPSTFKIRSPNTPLVERDNGTSSDAIEWTVKQPGTTILSHVLVKLDELDA